MTFNITDKYRQRVNEFAGKHENNSLLFDCNSCVEFSFEIKRKTITIEYRTLVDKGEYVSSIKKIKRFKVYSDGCLVIFKDGNFLFLPVTDNPDTDIKLISLCEFLYKKLGDFRFETVERLWVMDPLGENGQKYHKGFTLLDSPKAMIVISVLAFLMGIAFIWQRTLYNPVEKNECIKYSGAYMEYYHDDNVGIVFSNDDVYCIESSCVSGDLLEEMDNLEQGQGLQLLIHPDNDSIVELRAGGKEILDFYESQESMRKESNAFAVFGVIIEILGIVFLIYGIRNYKREKRQREEQSLMV